MSVMLEDPPQLRVAYLPWMERARCLNLTDQELKAFHPDDNGLSRRRIEEKAAPALATCVTCPVWRDCLRYAFGSPDSKNNGVYGATLAYERTTLEVAEKVARSRRSTALAERVKKGKRRC